MYSIKQASDYLGVSIQTIRRWEQAGKLSSERTAGGHRRFNPEELKTFKHRQANCCTLRFKDEHIERVESNPTLSASLTDVSFAEAMSDITARRVKQIYIDATFADSSNLSLLTQLADFYRIPVQLP